MSNSKLEATRHGGKNYVPLRGIAGNRGDHAGIRDILGALQTKSGVPRVDFAMVCEMYNQQDVLDEINAMPQWRVFRGEAKASVLITNTQTMRNLDDRVIDLLPAAKRMGKYNMQKDATGGMYHHEPSGRNMELYALHNIQTQMLPIRRAAAINHNQNFVDEVNPHKRLVIAGADWNAEWTGASMRPFRDANWKHSMDFPTHKRPNPRRNIDGFVWDDKDHAAPLLLKPDVKPIVVRGTDHLWYYCVWPILVR